MLTIHELSVEPTISSDLFTITAIVFSGFISTSLLLQKSEEIWLNSAPWSIRTLYYIPLTAPHVTSRLISGGIKGSCPFFLSLALSIFIVFFFGLSVSTRIVSQAQKFQTVLVVQVFQMLQMVYLNQMIQVFYMVQVFYVVHVVRELYALHSSWSVPPGFRAPIYSMSFSTVTKAFFLFHADLSFSRSKLFDAKISNLHKGRAIWVSW